MAEDPFRAELIHAIALELTQLGYRPCEQPGYVQRDGEEFEKPVAHDVWQSVRKLQREREDL